MKGWALRTVWQVGQIVDARIRGICETSIVFFIKIKLTLSIINFVERIPQGQCLQQTQLLHNFLFRALDSLKIGSPFSRVGYTHTGHSKPIA